MKRRSTPTKEAVLAVLTNTPKAMSQEAIERKIAIEIDRTTIYRVLNRLCEDGIAHKIVAEDGKQYFAVCGNNHNKMDIPRNHYHFRCTACETISCIPISVEPPKLNDYQIERINCVLIGVCNECR